MFSLISDKEDVFLNVNNEEGAELFVSSLSLHLYCAIVTQLNVSCFLTYSLHISLEDNALFLHFQINKSDINILTSLLSRVYESVN